MILDRFKLTDKVAIVTGAGKGIGRGTAIAFAEAGAHVVCAARTLADIESTVAEIEKLGRRALAVQCDVMQTENLDRLVESAMETFGRIDILVNNTGGTMPCPAMDTTEEFFEEALRFNVTTAFLLSQKVARKMVENDNTGAIVNISSRSADMVQTSFVAYGAAKAAMNMMTRNMAPEFAPRIRVNAISVGGVATDSLKVVLQNEAAEKQFNDGVPMNRPGDVEDIAAAALFLASPAAAWVTGKVFQVDGGVTAPAIWVPTPPV
ncbi:glucose 1-dehydrogenase [Halieaceae bacterium IMCC14734]|uniref:Glucose 1-dehydrogenase n=1 Tax=Candidatus Litorirhabdus singularis TaxID=2518993 RepID=A0ABT3TAL7_9GAMM|nr:glucose 1-dehydrogenase [Candidatus Litorirhabdus singularis]MCX2979316.1 glucose 1-dehydrogenase [Candidatus Litorirhabdus singularis]